MKTSRVLASIIGMSCLFYPSIASASESAIPYPQYPLLQIFTFLLLMLGPFKIIGPFAKVTKGMDTVQIRKIALEAIFFSSLTLLAVALVGEAALSSYGIPLPILALAGGIILFLVALQNVLNKFEPVESGNGKSEAVEHTSKSALKVALTPLSFPTIVTPYGIAALVVFLALSPGLQEKLAIGVIVFVIMLLNLLIMLVQRKILPILGIVLSILGAVLGVVQVALGLRIIHNSLKMMGLL